MISRPPPPGELLVSGQRGMSELIAVWLRRLLLTFPHTATLDVVVVLVLAPAARAEWGGMSGAFADPDGYVWEVAHNPGWTITDDGSIRI
jgi:hypothetical protein